MICQYCNDTGMVSFEANGDEVRCSCSLGKETSSFYEDNSLVDDLPQSKVAVGAARIVSTCPGGLRISECMFDPRTAKCPLCPQLKIVASWKKSRDGTRTIK